MHPLRVPRNRSAPCFMFLFKQTTTTTKTSSIICVRTPSNETPGGSDFGTLRQAREQDGGAQLTAGPPGCSGCLTSRCLAVWASAPSTRPALGEQVLGSYDCFKNQPGETAMEVSSKEQRRGENSATYQSTYTKENQSCGRHNQRCLSGSKKM